MQTNQAETWKIYLDACCLNRPFDDQTQDRIRLETEAITLIMTHLYTGSWQWIGSEILRIEIDQTPDPVRRVRVKSLLDKVHHEVSIEQTEAARGKHLETLGFKPYDALHIACAENSCAEVFLTTLPARLLQVSALGVSDDKLLRRANRLQTQLSVRVENPLTWLQEVTQT